VKPEEVLTPDALADIAITHRSKQVWKTMIKSIGKSIKLLLKLETAA
jgi:hypothetical protein